MSVMQWLLQEFEDSYKLAEALKLNGTPSFVIGDQILKGGRDLATMRQIVADIRARK